MRTSRSSRRTSRWLRVGALTLVMIVFGVGSAGPASATPAPGLPSTSATPAPGLPSTSATPAPGLPSRGLPSHGTLVKARPLAKEIRLESAGSALAVWYTSIDFAGRPTVVSGSLTLPRGLAPKGGWPVVSFGHGQGGTADGCAPSRIGHGDLEVAVLEPLLAAGYAIAATDYQGIGTPGEAGLVDGPSEGRALIDIVLAARRIAPLSARWAALGYSLGGHASLFAASFASEYAPSLDHVGTITMAGLTQLRMLTGGPATLAPTGPVNGQAPYLMRGIEITHPGQVDFGPYLTQTGRDLLTAAGQLCLGDMFARVAGLTNGDLFTDPQAVLAEFAHWYEEEEIPAVRLAAPAKLVHGLDDALPAVFSEITAGQLAAAGSDATYLPVPGKDHVTLPPAIATEVVDWMNDYFSA